MDPLLIDVPERIETENLVLRSPRRGDGRDRQRRRPGFARRARPVAALGRRRA